MSLRTRSVFELWGWRLTDGAWQHASFPGHRIEVTPAEGPWRRIVWTHHRPSASTIVGDGLSGLDYHLMVLNHEIERDVAARLRA